MSVVNSPTELTKVAAPNLPLAPGQYDSRYQEQLNNVLRLYFNRLDNLIGQLSTDVSSGSFTTLTAQTETINGTGQNLITRSQQFANATYGSSTAIRTENQTIAPDGTNTGALIQATAISYGGLVRQFSSTYLPSTTYTISVYAKAGTSNFVGLRASGGCVSAIDSYCHFNLATGVATAITPISGTIVSVAMTSAGSGWYRCSVTYTTGTTVSNNLSDFSIVTSTGGTNPVYAGTETIFAWGLQVEFGPTANTYIPTTTAAIYGTPNLSFRGVANIGLQADGSLFVQPAGTGALQAQATTSTTVGGNARGANAVDWQTARGAASSVASGTFSVLGGGSSNGVNSAYGGTLSGVSNNTTGFASVVTGGWSNSATGGQTAVVGGYSNSGTGAFNFIGGGTLNSGTANAAVTTQVGTMNGTTAVTLSAANAAIRVGQYITGTSIAFQTYVAAISGTSLTLSLAASGSSTNNLAFFTPNGVVVGGGNNQATGSYSFIGGGGDAGTAANRNVASGDWSVVGGGRANTASGASSFVGGGGVSGGGNTASGELSFIGGGRQNVASGLESCIIGGVANTANGYLSVVLGGRTATTRVIIGNIVGSASESPIGGTGVSQFGILILGKQTTDATATVLTSNGGSSSTTNQVILPNNSAYYFKVEIIANVTGGGNTSGWELKGVIKRGANAASTAIVGSVTSTLIAQDAGASTWVVSATADTTNGGLKITVTGQASTTIRWVAKASTTEVTF